MVYVIQNMTTHSIKVGHSSDPWSRLAQLQVGHEHALDLIGMLDAGEAEITSFVPSLRTARSQFLPATEQETPSDVKVPEVPDPDNHRIVTQTNPTDVLSAAVDVPNGPSIAESKLEATSSTASSPILEEHSGDGHTNGDGKTFTVVCAAGMELSPIDTSQSKREEQLTCAHPVESHSSKLQDSEYQVAVTDSAADDGPFEIDAKTVPEQRNSAEMPLADPRVFAAVADLFHAEESAKSDPDSLLVDGLAEWMPLLSVAIEDEEDDDDQVESFFSELTEEELYMLI